MNYRKVMTKLNENKTMASMNYFDSSRKNLTYFLNGSQYYTNHNGNACVEEFSIGKNGEVVNKMFFSDLML
jgi:hypothetical protein